MIKIKIILHKKSFWWSRFEIFEKIWKNEEYYMYSFVCIANNKGKEA